MLWNSAGPFWFRMNQAHKKGGPFRIRLFENRSAASLVCKCDVDPAAFLIEEDVAGSKSEEGMILAHADISTWMPFGAALADEDVSCDDDFATELFHAETLAV